MKISVPYYSQFTDINDSYWMPRACLPTCLKMVLDFYKKADETDLISLIKKGEALGGYGKSGWYHDAIVSLAKEFGLEAHREEKMDSSLGLEEIKNSLDQNKPVIVSIVKDILGQTKFHTVVITGYELNDKNVSGFYFHDPESTASDRSREPLFVEIETFNKEWRKMAIFIG